MPIVQLCVLCPYRVKSTRAVYTLTLSLGILCGTSDIQKYAGNVTKQLLTRNLTYFINKPHATLCKLCMMQAPCWFCESVHPMERVHAVNSSGQKHT